MFQETNLSYLKAWKDTIVLIFFKNFFFLLAGNYIEVALSTSVTAEKTVSNVYKKNWMVKKRTLETHKKEHGKNN